LDPHPKDLIENLGIIMHIHLAKSFFYITVRYGHRSLIVETESHQKPHKLACGMNGILLEQGFLGGGESPNHRVPPHRGGRRLPQKPPSLLGGSSL
jgi:hypothetical protein